VRKRIRTSGSTPEQVQMWANERERPRPHTCAHVAADGHRWQPIMCVVGSQIGYIDADHDSYMGEVRLTGLFSSPSFAAIHFTVADGTRQRERPRKLTTKCGRTRSRRLGPNVRGKTRNAQEREQCRARAVRALLATALCTHRSRSPCTAPAR